MAAITTASPKLWLQALYTIPRVDLARVDPVSRWLILARVSVVVMTATSAAIGGLLAARDDALDVSLLVLTVVGLVLAHTGSNLVNDFWDFRHGADTPDSPRVNYGPHPFASEGVQVRSFVLVTMAILAAATAIGVYLTVASGPGVLVFALTGAFVLLFYSGGPLPMKYFGLGEVAVFIVWGPLMIGGSYYVLAGDLPPWVIVASIPYALGVTTVLMGKHVDKVDFDRGRKIRTLPVLLGEAPARRLTQLLSLAMYAAVAGVVVWQRMPGLLLVVAALPMLGTMLRAYNAPKPPALQERYPGSPLWYVGFAFIHMRRFGVLFVAGLILQLIVEAAI